MLRMWRWVPWGETQVSLLDLLLWIEWWFSAYSMQTMHRGTLGLCHFESSCTFLMQLPVKWALLGPLFCSDQMAWKWTHWCKAFLRNEENVIKVCLMFLILWNIFLQVVPQDEMSKDATKISVSLYLLQYMLFPACVASLLHFCICLVGNLVSNRGLITKETTQ